MRKSRAEGRRGVLGPAPPPLQQQQGGARGDEWRCAPGSPGRQVSGTNQCTGPLPAVRTRKEFMDHLESMIITPIDGDGSAGQGRLWELEAYVIETDGHMAAEYRSDTLSWDMSDTGVKDIKILRASLGGNRHEFFADMSDRRFMVLHTNSRAGEAKRAVDAIIRARPRELDRMWMSHAVLDAVARKEGNALRGFGSDYRGCAAGGRTGGREKGLRVGASGCLAPRLEYLARSDSQLKNAIAYRTVRVMRGGEGGGDSDHVQDDIHSEGHFAIKEGRSVQDHLSLVDMSKELYSRAVSRIEECRLGAAKSGGRVRARGDPLNIEFSEKVSDVPQLVRGMFNSARPFRLWGLDEEIEDGYYSVAGVDLHTGDPVNFEIDGGMMRVYLSKQGRGSTAMRLLCNLQAGFGTAVRCRQVEQAVRG